MSGFLCALQLSDSAFPSGRYTLSYGLESFAQQGELRPSGLASLLGDCIRFGVGPSDGVALACAHRADDLDEVVRIDQRLSAVKLAREGREASQRTGRALLGTALDAFDVAALRPYGELVRAGSSPGNHAVVLGRLTAALEVPRVEAVACELYAFAAGWVAAAVRLGLLDHRAAQHMLYEAHPAINKTAARAANGTVGQISSCTPLVDVMSMRHESAQLRLFAS
jgi:urease accessory protein